MTDPMDVAFAVNGTPHRVTVEPRRVLADIRDDLRLTGTHLGCEHCVCGTCTVLVDGDPVRSCLVLAVQCRGADVRTARAPRPPPTVRSTRCRRRYPPSTPGFLMLLHGALDDDPTVVDDRERLDALPASNLCRCTGYESIRRKPQHRSTLSPST